MPPFFRWTHFAGLLLLLLFGGQSYAQEKIKIDQADALEGGKDKQGTSYQKLIGNVRLVQEDTRIYGDSVLLYRDRNVTEVFGKIVRIEKGDSITITGGRLLYDGNQKLAEMRNNVVYRDPSMTLYTDYLDFDMPRNLAYYYQGGKLIDTANVLTSRRGSYHTVTHLAAFKDSVLLDNPDYDLRADTLEYNTQTQVAYTRGPTDILSNEGDKLFAQAGSEFKTTEKQSAFNLGTVETESYRIRADYLFVDDLKKQYVARQNVEMVAKDNNVIITGDTAIYQRELGRATVYGHALMKRVMDLDTLFMTADTLVSVEDSIPANDRILAYQRVKIFREDLQGVADSLAYHITDSTLYFYQDPVLWSQENQINADSIRMEISGGTIDALYTVDNSFVVSQDTLNNYNQIKGRDMKASFRDGAISRVDVYGNGESIYYILENDSLMVGMNRILSSDIRIDFVDSALDMIRTRPKTEGSLIPPHEIEAENERLSGFEWRADRRPTRREVVGAESDPREEPLGGEIRLPPVRKPPTLPNSR
ncbi:MAG: OstA-like protein [Tunicatimonas sp.]